MKKIIKKLHLWLSLPVGLIITMMCLTGAILVFQDTVLEWLNPDFYYVETVTDEPMPLGKLFDKAESQLPASVHLSSITIPGQNNRNYEFSIEGKRHASITIDPYSGQVRNQKEKGKIFFRTVFRLHRWLLFPTKKGEFSLGKFLTGTSTLLFFFILISGIIIWIPKNVKLLKQRLSVKASNGSYRFWYDTHLAVGIYGAIFLIALCLTGLTWSFDWYRDSVYKIFGVEAVQSGHTTYNNVKQSNSQNNYRDRSARGIKEIGETQKKAVDYTVWDKVLLELKQRVPDYKKMTIKQGTAKVYTSMQMEGVADHYTFNETTGKITGVKYYKDSADRALKIRLWIYNIHTGKWGGTITLILTFIASLLGASLPLTGYYLYFKKLALKQKKKKYMARQIDV